MINSLCNVILSDAPFIFQDIFMRALRDSLNGTFFMAQAKCRQSDEGEKDSELKEN